MKLYNFKKWRRARAFFSGSGILEKLRFFRLIVFGFSNEGPARLILFRNITCVFPWNWKLKPRLRLKLADGIIFNFQRVGKFEVWLCGGNFYPLIIFVAQNILKKNFFSFWKMKNHPCLKKLFTFGYTNIIWFELYFSFLKWDNHGSKS